MKKAIRNAATSVDHNIAQTNRVEPLESRLLLANTPIVVTNANDSGAGSLRDALTQSNTITGVDTIAFNIPATASKVIHLASPLPDLWDPGIMDGTTQPGYTNKPLVQIDGAAAGAGATGMKMWGGSTIKGMSITNFGGGAVDMFNRGFSGNTVQSSWIGVDLSGALAGNNASGIGIWNTANNVIGGPNAADRNVISGSKAAFGVFVQGAAATNNLIQNNYLGTDPTGTAARGNAKCGVGVQDAPNTKVLNNLLSGNLNNGMLIINAATTGTIVQGNIVGLNAAGTAPLPNLWYGLEIQSANNTIGGPTAAQRNIFSANGEAGIVLYRAGATNNLIQGNYIGTDVTGNVDFGNTYQGIAISEGPSANTIQGNLISGNNAEGVGIFPGNNNTLQGNTIGLGANGAPLTNGTYAVTFVNSSGNVVGGTAAGQANVIYSGHPSGTFLSPAGNTISTNSIVSGQTQASVPGAFALSAPTYAANENQGSVTITVIRTANTNVAAAVNYATANVTATAGSDYTAATGTLSFAAGETSKTFSIALTNDTAVEVAETLTIALSAPTAGATLGTPASATLTITSDDLPDTTPPAVTSATFVYAAAQQKLRYTFSENVAASLSAADLYVADTTTFQSYSPATYSYDTTSNTATFTFAATLPKGVYKATLFAEGVTDAAGNQLDGDANGLAGGANVLNFWHMPGDANRDGKVDFTDMTAMAQHYNTPSGMTLATGDFNFDGATDFNDMVLLGQNYNTSMNLPAGAAPAPAPAPAILSSPDETASVTSTPAPAAKPRVAKATPVKRPAFSAKRI